MSTLRGGTDPLGNARCCCPAALGQPERRRLVIPHGTGARGRLSAVTQQSLPASLGLFRAGSFLFAAPSPCCWAPQVPSRSLAALFTPVPSRRDKAQHCTRVGLHLPFPSATKPPGPELSISFLQHQVSSPGWVRPHRPPGGTPTHHPN